MLKKYVSHAKVYLLENAQGDRRVITGSANLSERAFSEQQPETLVVFDDDPAAWIHYDRMYTHIRDTATNELEIPEEKIEKAEIEIADTPVLANEHETLLVVQPRIPIETLSLSTQIERIETLKRATFDKLPMQLPAIKNGVQTISAGIKREISRLKFVKRQEEVNESNRNLSIDRTKRKILLNGAAFPLEFQEEHVNTDVSLLRRFWTNYEAAFSGDVKRLQHDYWILMSWLYFAPFICDMRASALIRDEDVVRYPQFAIVFGKSNCGKTSLIDTLMTSMIGIAHTVEKRAFTTTDLRALQFSYGRHPVVFDDISRRAFSRHGIDLIKDEMLAPTAESPCFLLSLNADPHSFPDEVVKRSLMIYTTTALPTHKEHLRPTLQSSVQDVRKALTGHLYRKYLVQMMDVLDGNSLIYDWLEESSRTLCEIFKNSVDSDLPDWCQEVTYLDYANRRYDRIRDRLSSLFRDATYSNNEGASTSGWTLNKDQVIYWEPRDAFGRSGFDWSEIPSTLLDTDASGGDRTVLDRAELEEFLERKLEPIRTRSNWLSKFLRQD